MKKYKLSILYAVVLLVPSALYALVNFYWWLFDGNSINGDKMMVAIVVLFVFGLLGVPIVLTEGDL